MKFAIVGAGAIGAFVGAMLANSGEDVTLIARGPHLRAMQQRGVRVRGEVGEFAAHPAATDDPAAVGPVDDIRMLVQAHVIDVLRTGRRRETRNRVRSGREVRQEF